MEGQPVRRNLRVVCVGIVVAKIGDSPSGVKTHSPDCDDKPKGITPNKGKLHFPKHCAKGDKKPQVKVSFRTGHAKQYEEESGKWKPFFFRFDNKEMTRKKQKKRKEHGLEAKGSPIDHKSILMANTIS